MNEEPNLHVETVDPLPKSEKDNKSKKTLIIAGIAIVVIGAVACVYFLQEMRIAKINDEHSAKIEKLTKDNSELQAKLEKKADGDSNDPTNEKSASTESLTDIVESIHDAITSENYAALEGRMTSSVEVILAASEFGGSKTPSEAAKSLEYIKSSTGTWSFSIPMSTLTEWHSGSYAQYLPTDGGIIGLSTDGYIVALTLNSDNKITKIFMALESVM